MQLAQESGLLSATNKQESVGQLFQSAFDVIKKIQYRTEYTYKAAITQKILLGTHSLNTASMLSEFRIHDRKADLIILNGTGTVYEIKSERDSLSRLNDQIDRYRTVFSNVCVVAGDNHVSQVEKLVPDTVGIMRLSKRYTLQVVRKATEDHSRLDALAIFNALSTREAQLVLDDLGIEYPNVPNTIRRQEFAKIFSCIPPVELYKFSLITLRKVRNLSKIKCLIDEIPESLHNAVLTSDLRKRDYERFLGSISTPLEEAFRWV